MHPIDFVLEQEGGFVDDPADPGGATKYGISLRFLRTMDPELADLDRDGDIDADDVFMMTEDQARAAYMDHFFTPLEIWRYPRYLGTALLDTAVNMGRTTSIILMQTALVDMGRRLGIDGIIGPNTLEAIRRVDTDRLADRMLLGRVFRYSLLCEQNQDLRRFLPGWINRVRRLKSFAGGNA